VAELYALQDIVPELDQLGVTLLALTPQVPARSQEMIAKQALAFDILSDPGNAYAALLGLRFELPAELKSIYGSFGIDLAQSNGEGSWTLPIPARIVVDRLGIVRAVDADPDYTVRPEPTKTLADVRALGG
jgi:peroxiredoxin